MSTFSPCFMLLRKSRAEENDRDALSRHRSILCDLAQRDGVEIAHVCEELMSGEKLARRPQFRQLLEIIEKLPDGSGAVLYVMDADRISRGKLTERGQIQDLLIRKGFRIRTPGGYADLSVPDELLLHEVKGTLAHHYVLKFKERVAHTRSLQIKNGRLRGGRVPFGYLWDFKNKAPTRDPLRFPILQAWCHEAFFLSTVELGKKYGVPQQTVYTALTSPIICGWPAKVRDARGKLLPRSQWVWPEQAGDYEAALGREEWERLQAAILARRNGHGGRMLTEDAWCRGLLRLEGAGPGCRVHLSSVIWDGARVPTYVFIRYAEGRKRHLGYISRPEVHGVVYGALKSICADPGWVVRAIERDWQRSQQERPDVAALEVRREALRKELVAHQRSLATTDDEEDAAAIHAAVLEVKAELAQVKASITRAGADGEGLSRTEREFMLGAIADFGPFWDRFDDSGRAVIARGLLSEVRVTLSRGEGPRFERQVVPVPRYSREGY